MESQNNITKNSFISLLQILPICVLNYIQEFILISWENRSLKENAAGEKSWRSIFNVNKMMHESQIRKETIFLSLNCVNSLNFFDSKDFAEKVLRLIHSPKNQLAIKLDCTPFFTAKMLKKIFKFNSLKSPLQNLYSLTIHGYHGIVNLENIKNIIFVELSNCSNIPFFNSQHYEIDLITKQISKLTTAGSASPEPPLVGVVSLTFKQCGEIDQLFPLPNLRTLVIHNCNNIPIDDIFQKEFFPNLMEFSLTDQRLTNDHLPKLFQFSPKRKLSLTAQALSTNLQYLQSIEHLSLSFCFQLQEIPFLPANITSLTLQHCHQVHSISHLRGLRSLQLFSCSKISQIDFLQMNQLEILDISYCPGIQNLNIIHSHSITSSESSSIGHKMRNLRITNCFNLISLNIDHQVMYCDLTLCSNLSTIDIEKPNRIYFLTLKFCPLPVITGTVTVMKELKK